MTEFFLELIALGLVKFPVFYGIQIFMKVSKRPPFSDEFSQFSYNSISFLEIHFNIPPVLS